jgi:hypothetical protein
LLHRLIGIFVRTVEPVRPGRSSPRRQGLYAPERK